MALTHPSQIETSISRLPQTAYGTPRAAGDDYRRIISESVGVATEGLNFEDDAGYENGSDLAIDTWATTAETSVDLSPKLNFQDIGYQLLSALGGYSVSGPDGGLYTHAFTPQSMNTSRQLPARTILKKYGALRLMMYPDMVSSNLTISSGKMGRISTAQSFVGSGDREKDPASYVSPSIVSDREFAYAAQGSLRLSESGVGTRQVETATVASGVTLGGTIITTITAAGLTGSPLAISTTTTNGDTAAAVAGKIRTSLRANAVLNAMFEITGATTAIILTRRTKSADDATLNIATAAGTATGFTDAPTSANTTAGVAGTSTDYSCNLESWSIQLNNPTLDDGYRICSPFVVAGDPASGQTRSEYFVGAREYTLAFSARDTGTDNIEDWLRAGTIVDIDIPILGTETNDYSLRMAHTRARVVQAQPITDAGGFIGIDGQIRLLAAAAGDGSIPLTFTLVNNVASYTS
jgi:hypothetical protein